MTLPPPIPEFLESFFLKYGSFIPLSETDVLEHLKTKTDVDLSKKRVLETHTLTQDLIIIPIDHEYKGL